MNRRVAIKKASLMLGMAVGSPTVLTILNGCIPKKAINWTPIFFTENQAVLVANIADIILPKTNTPGALDVGVDAFIDFIINDCYSSIEQDRFINDLNELDNESDSLYGKSFIKLDQETKVKFLTLLDKRAEKTKLASTNYIRPIYAQLKELILLGYFTSEEIITSHLEYVPIPTRLDGCTPLKSNQKVIVGNQI